MDIKAFMQKYGVTAGVAGGCLVIGSQFGTCTVAPTAPTPEAEEASATEESEAEEPKAEEPADEAIED
tara:strand:+ start:841 stop:1044 length:204 start_codon:yes stop_codon:yes gene_type:complete